MDAHQKAPRSASVVTIQALSVAIIALEVLLWGSILVPALSNFLAQLIRPTQVRVGLLIVLPPLLGALDLVACVIALLRPSASTRRVVLLGVIVGVIGILTGVFWVALVSGLLGQVY